MNNKEEIRFFSPEKEYGFLSNYFESPIMLKKRKWKSVEHYYQAQKFAGTIHEDRVREIDSPNGAKSYAHSLHWLWRYDWEEVKIEVMREAVRAKFFQSAILANELLATGDAVLIENSKKDYLWGIGDGTGKSLLGKMLMEIREELMEQKER